MQRLTRVVLGFVVLLAGACSVAGAPAKRAPAVAVPEATLDLAGPGTASADGRGCLIDQRGALACVIVETGWPLRVRRFEIRDKEPIVEIAGAWGALALRMRSGHVAELGTLPPAAPRLHRWPVSIRATRVAAAADSVCALTADGTVFCRQGGQCVLASNGTFACREGGVPTRIGLPAPVRELLSDSCAIDEQARLYCWNGFGGKPENLDPVEVFADVHGGAALGDGNVCAIVGPDREILCVGPNLNRPLHEGPPGEYWEYVPGDIDGVDAVLAADSNYAIARGWLWTTSSMSLHQGGDPFFARPEGALPPSAPDEDFSRIRFRPVRPVDPDAVVWSAGGCLCETRAGQRRCAQNGQAGWPTDDVAPPQTPRE